MQNNTVYSLKFSVYTVFLVAGVGFEPHDLRVMSSNSVVLYLYVSFNKM